MSGVGWTRLRGDLVRFADSRWAAVAVVAAAVLVPLIGSWDRDFYALEADLILASRGTFAEIEAVLTGTLKDQSPLYLWMLHLWQAVLGEGPRTIRALSLLWGGAAALYTYLLGRTWRDHRVGLVAAALLIAMPAFIEHARSARMYMIFVACAVGALAHAVRYLRGGHWADLLGCGVLCTAGIYNHFFGFGTAALALGTLVGGTLWAPPRRQIEWGVAVSLAVGAAAIPQVLRMRAAWSMAEGKGNFYSAPGEWHTFFPMVNAEQFFGNLQPGDVIPLPDPGPFLVCYAPLLALAVWGVVRLESWWPRIVAGVWFFGSQAVMFILRAVLEADIRPRYLSFLMPAAALLVAAALLPRPRAGAPAEGRPAWARRWVPRLLLVPLVALLVSGSIAKMAQRGRPYRDVAAWCEQQMDDGDRLATFPGWTMNAVRLHTDYPVYPGGNAKMLRAAGSGGRLVLVESQMSFHDSRRELDWLEDRALLVEQRQFHRTRVYVFDFDGMEAARRELRRDWGRRVRDAEGEGLRLAVTGDVVVTDWSRGPRQGALRDLRGVLRQADLAVAFVVPPAGKAPHAADQRRADDIARGLAGDGVDIAAMTGPAWQGRSTRAGANAAAMAPALQGTLIDGGEHTVSAHGVDVVLLTRHLDGPSAVDDALLQQVRRLAAGGTHVVLLLSWPTGPDGLEVPWQREAGRALLDAGASAVLGRSGGRDVPLEVTSSGVLATNLGAVAHDRKRSREDQGWLGRAMVLVLHADGTVGLETMVLRLAADGNPVPAKRRPTAIAPVPARDDVGYRFRDHLAGATLAVVGGPHDGAVFEPDEVDPRDPRRWRESRSWGSSWWQGVAEGVGQADGIQRAAIWAHPPPGGALELHYPAVPLGDRIDGMLAVDDGGFDKVRKGERRPRMKPTRVEVLIDGEPLATVEGADEPGWRGFRVDTGAFAGGTHDVTFRVQARRHRNHWFWLDGWTVDERPAATAEAAVGSGPVSPVFREQLDRARVGVRHLDGRYRACSKAQPGSGYIPGEEKGPDGEGLLSQRRRCGRKSDSWNVVATTRQQAGGDLRDCVWAHPVDGAAIEIEYTGLTLRDQISGFHGITDYALDRRDYPVYLEIESEGEVLYRGNVADEAGWHEFAVDTSAWSGSRRDVLLRIEADKQRWRHYCFDLEIR